MTVILTFEFLTTKSAECYRLQIVADAASRIALTYKQDEQSKRVVVMSTFGERRISRRFKPRRVIT